jgi:TolB-like protein
MLLVLDGHTLDVDRRELRRGGNPVAATPQVFDLLLYLICNRDRVVSKDELIGSVWGGRIVSDSALTTRINAVRAVLGDTGAERRFIRTIHRKGVRFVGDVRETPAETNAVWRLNPTAREPVTLTVPDQPSIVVLPFQNISGDPEQEYFADGMVEEIITALSRIRWLFVIARNSSFTYKGKAVDVRQLGHDLGVRYVLEGSVRKGGGRVQQRYSTRSVGSKIAGAIAASGSISRAGRSFWVLTMRSRSRSSPTRWAISTRTSRPRSLLSTVRRYLIRAAPMDGASVGFSGCMRVNARWRSSISRNRFVSARVSRDGPS